MANNFNWRQSVSLEVPNQFVQQNNGQKRLNAATMQQLRDTLSQNYDVELNNDVIILRTQGDLIGRIKQREVHRAINNLGVPGAPRPRLRYHDVLDVIIEVANQNHRNMVEDAVRQVLNMGPRFNLANFAALGEGEGTPEPPGFGQPGPAVPNMNLDGGRKRRNKKSKKLNTRSKRRRVYRKTIKH